MDPSLFTLFGWAALTYYWLHANATFFEAIADAIEERDAAIKVQYFDKGYNFCLKHNNAEETSDDEKA